MSDSQALAVPLVAADFFGVGRLFFFAGPSSAGPSPPVAFTTRAFALQAEIPGPGIQVLVHMGCHRTVLCLTADAPVVGFIGCLHASHVGLADGGVVNDRVRIVLPNDAAATTLHLERCRPGFIYVLGWEILELHSGQTRGKLAHFLPTQQAQGLLLENSALPPFLQFGPAPIAYHHAPVAEIGG